MSNPTSLVDIAEYHTDVETSLRLYFSTKNPNYLTRFTAYLPSELVAELTERVSETDMRSALVVLARIEAAFRKDYIGRCNLKLSDDVSISFRKIHKKRGIKARLDEDILETWRQNINKYDGKIISNLRGMLKFRHWLAHGRYWNFGTKYSFQDVYSLGHVVLTNFPLLD